MRQMIANQHDLLKMTPCFLIAIAFAIQSQIVKNENGIDDKNGSAAEIFGKLDIYGWHTLGVVIVSAVIIFCEAKESMLIMSGVYLIYGLARIVIRHGIGYDFLEYYLYAARLVYATLVSLLWYLQAAHCAFNANENGLTFSLIICWGIAQANISYDVGFFCMTHDRSNLLIDGLHLLALCINGLVMWKLNILDNKDKQKERAQRLHQIEQNGQEVAGNVDQIEQVEKEDAGSVDQLEQEDAGNVDQIEQVEEVKQNGQASKRLLVVFTLVAFYTYMVSAYMSPNSPLRNGFIHHLNETEKQSMALISCFYGTSFLAGAFFIALLRENGIVSFIPEVIPIVGHLSVYLIIYFNFGGVSFETLLDHGDKFYLAVFCACVVGFCLAILNVQLLSFYVANFCERTKNPDRIMWGATSLISAAMFFAKSSTGGSAQLTTLCLAALLCAVGLYYLKNSDKVEKFCQGMYTWMFTNKSTPQNSPGRKRIAPTNLNDGVQMGFN